MQHQPISSFSFEGHGDLAFIDLFYKFHILPATFNMETEIDEFFEGAEKVLEVSFIFKDKTYKNDLRKIPKYEINDLLEKVKCSILRTTLAPGFDAFVLSESSLFIYDTRFILKTCGTTGTLCALPNLLDLVEKYTSLEAKEIFYSRKNFLRPELQLDPHKDFDTEVAFLGNYFKGGRSICLGDEGEDCWYLYSNELSSKISYFLGPKWDLFYKHPDQTFEIIMQDLDQKKMLCFTKKGSKSEEEATKKSGIDKLLPDMQVDSFLFDPYGYSMNGIIKGKYYCTIHITPQPQCSYLSFETNYPMKSVDGLVMNLIEKFAPGRFQAMMIYNDMAPVVSNPLSFFVPNYHQVTMISNKSGSYDVDYVKFCNKFPS